MTVAQNSGILRDGKIAWGKYRGASIADVPTQYLEFLLQSCEITIAQLQSELDRRSQVAEADMSWAEKIVQAGYVTLAKRFHPDTGGTENDMREVNAAVEKLRDLLRECGA
jgi:hypothetical protein